MKRKNLLFIAYFYPPINKSASRRTEKLVKYLARIDWNVTLICADDFHLSSENENSVCSNLDRNKFVSVFRIKDDLQFFRKRMISKERQAGLSYEKNTHYFGTKKSIKSVLKQMVLFPDETAFWFIRAYRKCAKLCRSQKYSAMFSTFGPPSAHLLGLVICKKYGIPWIADFRDPWTDNIYIPRKGLLGTFHHSIERKVLNYASYVTAVTPGFAHFFMDKTEPSKVRVLTNGFDEEDFCMEKKLPQTKILTFFYGGNVLKSKRTKAFDSFLLSIQQLQNSDEINTRYIKLIYMGNEGRIVMQMAKKKNLGHIIKDIGFGSFSQVIENMHLSHVLLFIQNLEQGAENEHSGKIFEYFGAKKPILALTSKNAQVKDLFDESFCGWCLDAENIHAVKSRIKNIYIQFEKYGKVEFPSNDLVAIDKYSYFNIAENLSSLLNIIA